MLINFQKIAAISLNYKIGVGMEWLGLFRRLKGKKGCEMIL